MWDIDFLIIIWLIMCNVSLFLRFQGFLDSTYLLFPHCISESQEGPFFNEQCKVFVF